MTLETNSSVTLTSWNEHRKF